MKERILVVDDENEFLELTQSWLSKQGFEVLIARDGAEGLRRFFVGRPALVLLDANMPRMDGWEVCRRIRDMSDIPVIMVTVNRQKADVLRGFSAGVDDYIAKPVDFNELMARVRAVLRRVGSEAHEDEPSSFHDGQLQIEWRSRQVWVRGERVKLSPTEFKILACLIKNRGWIVTHEQLLEKVWGPNYVGDKSFVKLYIRYLRQKIESSPSEPQLVLTERGIGYYFAMQNEESGSPGGWHSDAEQAVARHSS